MRFMPDRNWKEYNEALVRRGEILLDMDFIDSWPDELAKMNEGKVGKPFVYPESFLAMLAVVHAYLLPYRQIEGFTRALTKHVDGLKTPDYTSIAWRVARMGVTIDSSINGDDIVIAADSSGIKVANRGEWIRKRWHVRRGFIKMHIAVDKDTREIVAMKVTKEHVHDGRKLVPLVKQAVQNFHVSKVIADGAYDSRRNFRFLADNDIEPIIKVRKNASLKARGCMPRKLSVVEQKKDFDAWKKNHGYGYRWAAESAFSAFKRMFGEHVKAVRWKNMVKELMLKASIYNMFISMNPKGFG
jgi:transposase